MKVNERTGNELLMPHQSPYGNEEGARGLFSEQYFDSVKRQEMSSNVF